MSWQSSLARLEEVQTFFLTMGGILVSNQMKYLSDTIDRSREEKEREMAVDNLQQVGFWAVRANLDGHHPGRTARLNCPAVRSRPQMITTPQREQLSSLSAPVMRNDGVQVHLIQKGCSDYMDGLICFW